MLYQNIPYFQLVTGGRKPILDPLNEYQNSVINLLSNSVKEIEDLISDNSCKWGLYFEKQDLQAIRTLQLFKDKISIDPGKDISYSSIKRVNIRDLGSNNCEILIGYEMDGRQIYEDIFIAPEKYAYKSLEQLEMRKAEYLTKSLTTSHLYKQYNELKKQNLLIGLFSDIILLSRELDIEISMDELVEKLEKISIEEFYNNKKLFRVTTKKLLLFSLFLPKIKQNFEYLSSLYPYYQVKNEIDIISDAFGTGVATEYIPFERKKIRSTSRKNVRNVQSNMQRIFSEIERAVYPIEQLFAKDEIQKDLFSKITKYFPQAGQAALIGILVATGAATGGIGILAGILGIRALGDVFNSLQTNRESAARVKKASKTAFSWWRVLKDNLPVTIYETGEEIDDENTRCMQRDKRIFDKFPSHKKQQIEDNLKKSLKNRIHAGTVNRFAEVLEGSGIKFRTLASDIETAIEIDMPHKVGNILKTLPLPQDGDT